MTRYEFYKKHFAFPEEKPKNYSEDEIIWRLEMMPELKSSAIITKSNISKREKAVSMRIWNEQIV